MGGHGRAVELASVAQRRWRAEQARAYLRFSIMVRTETRLGTVVIADDHEVTRFGLAELLRAELGAKRVIAVGDFDSALAHLDGADLALVILDLDMPGLEGPHALADVRRARPDVKLVVLSASTGRDDILGCLAAGVHGYLVKTEGTKALLERLGDILRGRICVPTSLAEPGVVEEREPRRPSALPRAISALTARQQSTLRLLARGMSNKEIGRALAISDRTVKMHLSAIYRVLGVRNRTEAAMILHESAQAEEPID